MWKMPEVSVVDDRSPEALLRRIVKLRDERMRWPVIAKAVGLSEAEALSMWVRSTLVKRSA
jgi:hypothetical protein